MVNSNASLNIKPFDPSALKVEVKNATIGQLCDMLSKNLIDLQPDFQRKTDVWNKKKKSRLIESLILGLPLPSFYFYIDQENGKWVIIDGLQRLCALKDFVVEKTLKLSGLELLSNDLYDKTYDEFSYFEQLTIGMRSVTLNVLSGDAPVEAKYIIFRRINSEGTKLSPAEVRNALFHGESMKYVRELANSSEFKEATDNKVSDKRLLNQDFAARFIVFYVLGYKEYKDNNMEKFIGRGLLAIDQNTKKYSLRSLKETFYTSLKTCKQLLGDDCFRLPLDSNGKKLKGLKNKNISISLFEATMYAISQLDSQEKINILTNKESFVKAYEDLFKDESLRLSLNNGTNQNQAVIKRFSKIEGIVNKYSRKDD